MFERVRQGTRYVVLKEMLDARLWLVFFGSMFYFHFLFARTIHTKKANSFRSRFASFLKNPDNQISNAMLPIYASCRGKGVSPMPFGYF